ncbi:hypothetical protein KW782_01965 [Candidatus Parcubacteria bacterium]|nr:hypothetical protein [Candidatus Parcubacteria bacterium]
MKKVPAKKTTPKLKKKAPTRKFSAQKKGAIKKVSSKTPKKKIREKKPLITTGLIPELIVGDAPTEIAPIPSPIFASHFYETVPEVLLSGPMPTPTMEHAPAESTQTAVLERVEIAAIEPQPIKEEVSHYTEPIETIFTDLEPIAAATPVVNPAPLKKVHILKRMFRGFISIFTSFAKPNPLHSKNRNML